MRLPALLASGFWMTNWSPGERWWLLLVLGGASTMWNDEPLSTSLKSWVGWAWGEAGGARRAAASAAGTTARRWRDMGPPASIGGRARATVDALHESAITPGRPSYAGGP